ncbi:hypothetical protein LTR08_006413 [Meristemomyces frigidus]|nr:hypothetical protein LTR08_006413 [Meristemomyces frigidus]
MGQLPSSENIARAAALMEAARLPESEVYTPDTTPTPTSAPLYHGMNIHTTVARADKERIRLPSSLLPASTYSVVAADDVQPPHLADRTLVDTAHNDDDSAGTCIEHIVSGLYSPSSSSLRVSSATINAADTVSSPGCAPAASVHPRGDDNDVEQSAQQSHPDSAYSPPSTPQVSKMAITAAGTSAVPLWAGADYALAIAREPRLAGWAHALASVMREISQTTASAASIPAPVSVVEPSSVLTVTQDPRLKRVPQKRALSPASVAQPNSLLREAKKVKQMGPATAVMCVPGLQRPIISTAPVTLTETSPATDAKLEPALPESTGLPVLAKEAIPLQDVKKVKQGLLTEAVVCASSLPCPSSIAAAVPPKIETVQRTAAARDPRLRPALPKSAQASVPPPLKASTVKQENPLGAAVPGPVLPRPASNTLPLPSVGTSQKTPTAADPRPWQTRKERRARYTIPATVATSPAQNVKAIQQDAKAVREKAKVIQENARVIRENAKVIRKNAEVIRENAKVIRENAKVVKQNAKEIKQEVSGSATMWQAQQARRKRARSPDEAAAAFSPPVKVQKVDQMPLPAQKVDQVPLPAQKVDQVPLPDAVVRWLRQPPSEATKAWSSVLRKSSLVVYMANNGHGLPTEDQRQLLETLGKGESLVAWGPYGYQMHAAVKLAVLESHYASLARAPKAARQPFGNGLAVHPTAIYIASTRSLCDAFAQSLNACDRGPRIVVLWGDQPFTRGVGLDPSCQILCITPERLVDGLAKGLIGLDGAGLVVFDEMNMMLVPALKGHVDHIHELVSARQQSPGLATLHIGSHFTNVQVADITQSTGNVPNTETLALHTPDPPPSLVLSFAASATHQPTSRVHLAHDFIVETLKGHANRAVIVFTSDADDILKQFKQAGTWPGVRNEAATASQGSGQELSPAGAKALLTGAANVLLVSLDAENTGFLAPALRGFTGELYACIFRTHESDWERGRMRKYYDLVARIGCIEQMRGCFTILGPDETGCYGTLKGWMEGMGREMPGLSFPSFYT